MLNCSSFRGFMIKNSLFAVLLTISTVVFSYELPNELGASLEKGLFGEFSVERPDLFDVTTEQNPLNDAVNAGCVAVTNSKAYAAVASAAPTVFSNYKNESFDGYVDMDKAIEANPLSDKVSKLSAQAKNLFFSSKAEEKSRFSKVWNADVFGYKGAGKYVVASAAAAVLVAAYAVYSFARPTLEDQVVALVDKAQENPNLVLQELPGILAQCSNNDVRVQVLHYVLSQVAITPEIASVFNLQQ